MNRYNLESQMSYNDVGLLSESAFYYIRVSYVMKYLHQVNSAIVSKHLS